MLAGLGIETLSWPANSPDLSPIEHVWPWMKYWIEERYDIQSLTLPQLRVAVQEAWEAVPTELLRKLSLSMVDRLRACIANEGGDSGW